MAQEPEVTEWSGLLEATRLALTTLRLEDLEKLAARAEEMLQATALHDSMPPLNPKFSHAERRNLVSQQRLLGSFLSATGRNMEVLRHLHGTSPGPNGAVGLDSRWVR